MKGTLALVAALAAVIGFQELRLAILCPSMLELRGRELCDAPREKPVWVTLECSVPQAGAWVERSGPDRLLLPLSSPGEPETVIGMVSIEDFHQARALLASVGPIRIEGFALMPSAAEAREVAEALKPRGLTVASGFRILETGKRPAGVSVAAILFVTGSLVAASLAASLLASFLRRLLGAFAAPEASPAPWTPSRAPDTPSALPAAVADPAGSPADLPSEIPSEIPSEVPPEPPPASPPASEAQPVVDAGGDEAPSVSHCVLAPGQLSPPTSNASAGRLRAFAAPLVAAPSVSHCVLAPGQLSPPTSNASAGRLRAFAAPLVAAPSVSHCVLAPGQLSPPTSNASAGRLRAFAAPLVAAPSVSHCVLAPGQLSPPTSFAGAGRLRAFAAPLVAAHPSRPTPPSTEPVLDMNRAKKPTKHSEKTALTSLEPPLVVPVGTPADAAIEILEPFEVSADTVSQMAFRLARAALAAGRSLPRDLSKEAKADIHSMVKEVWDSAV